MKKVVRTATALAGRLAAFTLVELLRVIAPSSALAPVIAALSVLLVDRKTRWHRAEIFGAILFAVA